LAEGPAGIIESSRAFCRLFDEIVAKEPVYCISAPRISGDPSAKTGRQDDRSGSFVVALTLSRVGTFGTLVEAVHRRCQTVLQYCFYRIGGAIY